MYLTLLDAECFVPYGVLTIDVHTTVLVVPNHVYFTVCASDRSLAFIGSSKSLAFNITKDVHMSFFSSGVWVGNSYLSRDARKPVSRLSDHKPTCAPTEDG